MRRPRREPGMGYFKHLREAGDVELLARYIEDPEATRRLRGRASIAMASMAPGGGKAPLHEGPVDSAVIPYLAPLLEGDPDPRVRRNAAYGLRRTGDPAAIPALVVGLSTDDEATVVHSIFGVGDLKARKAVDALIGLVGDDRYAVDAAKALGKIGDERAIAHLRLEAAATHSGRRREKLEEAIAAIERR